MDQDQTKKMQNLGLQENEAKVYLALLELGRGTVSEISRIAKLNRTTAYDILERLALYGLSNRVAGKKKIYVAEPPHRLKQYLENKKRAAERRLAELDGLLPGLVSLYKTDLKPVIKIGEGKEEMSHIYNHALDAEGTIYSILNLKGYAEIFDLLGKEQSAERAKRGIKENVLAIDSTMAREWYEGAYKGRTKQKRLTTYKWIKADEKKFPVGELNVFDDKVIVMLSKPDENIAFEIQSQSFADFLKIVFEMTWNNVDNK
jgi:sugar-specific transcriptional regulator TrmB